MCEKCVGLDNTIKRFRDLTTTIGDPLTVELAQTLLAEALDKKQKLHPGVQDY